MAYTLRLLLDGTDSKIFALVCDNVCKMEQFLSEVAQVDLAAWASVMALLERCSMHGPPKNNEKSKSVGGGVFELKSKSTRICYFYDAGQMIICTHGFYKPQPKVQSSLIKAAIRLRKDYFVEQAKGLTGIEKSKI